MHQYQLVKEIEWISLIEDLGLAPRRWLPQKHSLFLFRPFEREGNWTRRSHLQCLDIEHSDRGEVGHRAKLTFAATAKSDALEASAVTKGGEREFAAGAYNLTDDRKSRP